MNKKGFTLIELLAIIVILAIIAIITVPIILNIYAVFLSGDFSSLSSFSTSISVRPVFYLKSGLSLSGTGAFGSEYTID